MAVAESFTDLLELSLLEREIATECARTDIECKAQPVVTNHPLPVYNCDEIEAPYCDADLRAADRADLERAVRYLDMLGLLVRPFAGKPHLVAFRDAA